MIYFLIGFMGSGKSTLGRVLARSLSAQFIDLDSYILKQEKVETINNIFEIGAAQDPDNQHAGNSYFRQIERRALHKIIEDQHHLQANLVIACGGGTPCYFDNMEFMNQNGTTIYLKMSSDRLYSRLRNSRKNRPLLAHLSEAELRDTINNMIAERETYYNQSLLSITNCQRDGRELIDLVHLQSIHRHTPIE